MSTGKLGKLVSGGPRTIEACQEVSMTTLRSGITPASSPTGHHHTEKKKKSVEQTIPT